MALASCPARHGQQDLAIGNVDLQARAVGGGAEQEQNGRSAATRSMGIVDGD